MPVRLEALISELKSSPNYEHWVPDYSPKSLEGAGRWFTENVETRLRTPEELEQIKRKLSFSVGIANEELTNKTFSIAIDLGMYLSKVFLKNFPSLDWSQPLGSVRSVDYGQPVLVGFGSVPFNPTRMMVTLAYGIAHGGKTGEALFQIYEIWSQMVSPKQVPT